MKKETRTGLLVTLAVLAVWIYIEVEPVLSQNGGNAFFGQGQPQQQNWNNNAPELVPQNYFGDNMRGGNYSQGMPSMPQNNMAMPRGDGLMVNPTNQYQGMPQGGFSMPQQGQQMPMMNQQMPQNMVPQNQGGIKGMIQKLFGAQEQQQQQQQGFFGGQPQQQQQQQGLFGGQPQQQQQGFFGGGSNNNDAMVHQAVGAVQQELSVAANNASQAEAYRSEAYSTSDRGAKSSAASEARYYANAARAAASRAMSKARGIPQAMSIASEVQAQASRAQSAADSASSAASGW